MFFRQSARLREKTALGLCGIALAVLVFMSALPVYLEAQLALAALILASLIAARRRCDRGTMRMAFLIAGAFLSLRYIVWRATATLSYHDSMSFVAALLLFFAEIYGVAIYFLGIFVNLQPAKRDSIPLPEDPDELPTVDILIPSYNEDPELLEITLMAATQIDFPAEKLNVFLLDDGGTLAKRENRIPALAEEARRRHQTLRELCADLGVRYLTRATNEHAKAGNINAALRVTYSDLILVLDADHVPSRDILRETVGWLIRDPDLSLVQTPHFFQSPDPIEKNLGTFQRMPSENQMFYGAIQLGLDSWNSSFFCGSAAVLRRSHLESIGGFQCLSITEDAETALELHARGYRSAYLRKPLIAGLQPETFTGFVIQRVRWAQGMIQIFLLKNPLTKRGLSLAQRLCYLSSSCFWLFPFARVIFLLAPSAYLLLGLKIYDTNLLGFLSYAVPHLMGATIVSHFLYGKVRWFLVSELYEVMQSLFCLRGLWAVLRRPRSPSFRVTPKGERLDRDYVSPLSKPFYVLSLITLASLAAGIHRLATVRADADATLITMGWASFNLVLIIGALGALFERRQIRRSWRMPASGRAKLQIGATEASVTLQELSLGGMSFVLAPFGLDPDVLQKNSPARLTIRAREMKAPLSLDLILGRRVDLPSGEIVVGARFAPCSLSDRADIVSLVHGDSTRWDESLARACGVRGPLSSAAFLMARGAKHAAIHIFALVSTQLSLSKELLWQHLAHQTTESHDDGIKTKQLDDSSGLSTASA
ncbi:MAG TPA: UDP-forming cellulose synthase catalytic subunit [Vicinamibacteria bacterium]|nr:UDP-forming cellulose synthase catalytic subunit [Vicinamibacteria bacterium]